MMPKLATLKIQQARNEPILANPEIQHFFRIIFSKNMFIFKAKEYQSEKLPIFDSQKSTKTTRKLHIMTLLYAAKVCQLFCNTRQRPEKGRYKIAIILLLSYFQNIRKQLWFQKSENKLISQPRMHRFQKSLCPFQTTPNLPNWIDFNPSYGNLKKIKIPKIWNLIKFLLLSWPMIIRKFISGGVSETS